MQILSGKFAIFNLILLDGRWMMEDGRWMMEDGRWKMEDGRGER